jgi:hypothetical protein
MQRLSTILSLLACTLALPAQAAESLCSPIEQTFFSCSVAGSGEVVSVCGARNTSANEGYLQYRFGLPGKIQFEYPTNRSGSTKLFWWDGRVHLDVTDDWLWFKNDGFIYSVFFIEDHDTPDRKPEFRTGVLVEKKGNENAGKDLKCAQRATGDFKRLADIVEWRENE